MVSRHYTIQYVYSKLKFPKSHDCQSCERFRVNFNFKYIPQSDLPEVKGEFNILGQVKANLIHFQPPSIFVMPTEAKLVCLFARRAQRENICAIARRSFRGHQNIMSNSRMLNCPDFWPMGNRICISVGLVLKLKYVVSCPFRLVTVFWFRWRINALLCEPLWMPISYADLFMFTRKYFRFIFSTAPWAATPPLPVVDAALNQTAGFCATLTYKVRYPMPDARCPWWARAIFNALVACGLWTTTSSFGLLLLQLAYASGHVNGNGIQSIATKSTQSPRPAGPRAWWMSQWIRRVLFPEWRPWQRQLQIQSSQPPELANNKWWPCTECPSKQNHKGIARGSQSDLSNGATWRVGVREWVTISPWHYYASFPLVYLWVWHDHSSFLSQVNEVPRIVIQLTRP